MSEERAPRARGPFGPLEALDEVQRQAFEAALRVTAELTSLSGGLADVTWLRPPDGQVAPLERAPEERSPVDVGRLRADVARAADTFAELLRSLLDVGFDAMDELSRRPGTRPLGTTPPGGSASLACTIRNGADPAAHLRAGVPQLTSVEGEVLDAVIAVAPDRFDLEPHQRLELEVTVGVPSTASPGRYHGLLLVAGLADAAHAITVDVVPDEEQEA